MSLKVSIMITTSVIMYFNDGCSIKLCIIIPPQPNVIQTVKYINDQLYHSQLKQNVFLYFMNFRLQNKDWDIISPLTCILCNSELLAIKENYTSSDVTGSTKAICKLSIIKSKNITVKQVLI